ncbi:MAG: glycosyltransferase [Coriobacteriia bacterium]|nr:glycosyltransferase [Coriobacteriia bacterium]
MPRFPYPPHKGDQVVAYRRIQTLSANHDITLLTFYEDDHELEGLAHLSQYCTAIHTVKLTKLQSWLNVISRGMFSRLPLQVLYYRSRRFNMNLQKMFLAEEFDLIHTYSLRMAQYTKDLAYPKVLELIDSMQLNFERRVQFETGLKRIVLAQELKRISAFEQEIGTHFDHMIVAASADREYLSRYPNVSVVPNGVSLDEFSPHDKSEKQPHTIIFSGNMNYFPNAQAVIWFAENCLPLIRAKCPDVIFVIAGKSPSKEVRDLEEPGKIIVTGFVESMPEQLRKAQVAIAPMQSGSGIQNKVLEAMACGLPVVTTTLGRGSIQAQDGTDLLVADSANDFAAAVCTLLSDQHRTSVIGASARNFVEQHYSWGIAAQSVSEIYRELV